VDRRRFLWLAASGLAAEGCERLPFLARPSAPPADDLDAIAAALVDGGQYIDGIPPIDFPDYDPVGAPAMPSSFFAPRAGEYHDDDVIDGIVPADGQPRAYPRFITVWHEIVNDIIAGQPISLTYCPLTGSTLVFSGRLDGVETSFGTSGRLYNSNLVMADRDSLSFWPQLLGIAVSGERKGERLRELPIAVTTTWGRWKARYPTTVVLTTRTGRVRPYRSSPYGDYDRNETIIFPVRARDGRFHPKRVVYGVREGGSATAVDKEAALRRGVTTFELRDRPFVALADEELQAVRVFRAEARGERVRFVRRGDAVVDERTGSRFSHMGIAVSGELVTERLEQVSATEVQWFAWYAFYPRTEVIS